MSNKTTQKSFLQTIQTKRKQLTISCNFISVVSSKVFLKCSNTIGNNCILKQWLIHGKWVTKIFLDYILSFISKNDEQAMELWVDSPVQVASSEGKSTIYSLAYTEPNLPFNPTHQKSPNTKLIINLAIKFSPEKICDLEFYDKSPSVHCLCNFCLELFCTQIGIAGTYTEHCNQSLIVPSLYL